MLPTPHEDDQIVNEFICQPVGIARHPSYSLQDDLAQGIVGDSSQVFDRVDRFPGRRAALPFATVAGRAVLSVQLSAIGRVTLGGTGDSVRCPGTDKRGGLMRDERSEASESSDRREPPPFGVAAPSRPSAPQQPDVDCGRVKTASHMGGTAG